MHSANLGVPQLTNQLAKTSDSPSFPQVDWSGVAHYDLRDAWMDVNISLLTLVGVMEAESLLRFCE